MAQENDVVLIYNEDKPVSFARVEDIYPDIKRDWYHMKLLLLQLPLQTVTWILRDTYIEGEEFTMNGERIRMETVVSPDEAKEKEEDKKKEKPLETPLKKKKTSKTKGSAKIISLIDRIKK
ncbi:conserved hypothetical protein [Candidatus Magnetomoraceae bacterium gMMP-15]